MKKINNSYLGTFYIEELKNREEQDRVKLFDSDKNYLDYLPLERYDDTDPTEEERYQGYIEMLEGFKSVPDLMDWLDMDYYWFIGSKSDAIKEWNKEYAYCNWIIDEQSIEANEWVNRIGDIYILIREY